MHLNRIHVYGPVEDQKNATVSALMLFGSIATDTVDAQDDHGRMCWTFASEGEPFCDIDRLSRRFPDLLFDVACRDQHGCVVIYKVMNECRWN